MTDRGLLDNPRVIAARTHAARIYRSRHTRRNLLIVVVTLVVFGLLGFFAAPPLIKSQLQRRMSRELGRPVTIGQVHLDPYTLKLVVDQLHIPSPDGKAPFVDIDQLTINASWASVFRMAPVLDELVVQRPRLAIARLEPQRFNFSDLLERFSKPSDPKATPKRFAVANISVHNGDIQFDDHVLDATHHVDKIEIGIPSLANFPAATDVFVKPLLAGRIDASPFHLDGQTKPFADSHESVITLNLDHLKLPKYLSYAPMPLPIAVPSGNLSGQLNVHFVSGKTNLLRLGGQLRLDDFKLTTAKGGGLIELAHGEFQLVDVQPMLSRYGLGTVQLNQAAIHYHAGPDGQSNFDALTSGDASDGENDKSTPMDVLIAQLDLQQGRFDYTDASAKGKPPIKLALDNLHGTIRGFSTLKAAPAPLDLTAQLNGGTIAAQGKLDLDRSQLTANIKLDQVEAAPLQPFVLALAPLQAKISRGQLQVQGQLIADWSKETNLHLEPTTVVLSDIALLRPKDKKPPVALKRLEINLTRFDRLGNLAKIDSVAINGLKLDAIRHRNGDVDLSSLWSSTPSATSDEPEMRWSIAHLDLTDSEVQLTDYASRPTAHINLHATHYKVDGLSADLKKSLKVSLTGKLGKGNYDINGQVRPQPLEARVTIKTRGLRVAPIQNFVSVPLNVNIKRAHLSSYGRLHYVDRGKADPRIDYRGDVVLGRVQIQDKVSGDDLLRWHSLSLDNLTMRLGVGAPKVDIRGIALSDFYARIILNSNGRLNLQDVVANETSAPISVTRAEGDTSKQSPQSTPTSAVVDKPAEPSGPAPEIQIGKITIHNGQLNYTDNFIRPNYSANVTDLGGQVGAFGTSDAPPAEMLLEGKLNENSPVDISGSINPLAPVAFLDIKAKADQVELTNLSAYSSKYAGYPIDSGVLTVDVHYQLDNRKLNADNHIFIEQLTFGDRVKEPGAHHLPVKLAVALLKNSEGQIDVHVPVTGSLDDPQFSMGGLIWHAFVNLIARAATAPFRLLASLGGKHADLGYVEFAPGSAVLDSTAKSRLGQLVSFLKSKPSLNLDIIGRIDPKVDEKGLRKVMVNDLVLKEAGRSDDDGKPKLPPDEYDHYLKKAYKHADFPKPKNAIGLTKSQPPEEMRKLLETNMPVDAKALRELADRRAAAVHGWLQGKVEEKRLSVKPPKLDADGISDKGKTSRVDFGLH